MSTLIWFCAKITISCFFLIQTTRQLNLSWIHIFLCIKISNILNGRRRESLYWPRLLLRYMIQRICKERSNMNMTMKSLQMLNWAIMKNKSKFWWQSKLNIVILSQSLKEIRSSISIIKRGAPSLWQYSLMQVADIFMYSTEIGILK